MTAEQTSGWEQWEDARRTKHLRLTLTDQDAKRMDSVQLAILADAATLIELAFAEDTPRQLAALRAERADARRVSELAPDELRDLLVRMGGAV
jgi:hypothetical protein